MLNLIRKEKFDIILPQAMRDNKIDMWIHIMRRGNPDPLRLDLGDDSGYFIFTDRGGDRIERAVLGAGGDTVRSCGAYDIFGSTNDLKRFVTERYPKRIAINMSERLAVADGLSQLIICGWSRPSVRSMKKDWSQPRNSLLISVREGWIVKLQPLPMRVK